MKNFLLSFSAVALALGFSSCTTLENRRDLYFGCECRTVKGPYTMMLKKGIPDSEVVTVETTTATETRSYK